MSQPDGFDVIGIRAPHPTWHFNGPEYAESTFGIHIGKVVDQQYAPTNDAIEECGGTLNFDVGPVGPIKVRCSVCDFFLLFPKEAWQWKDVVFEWIQMVFSTALIAIINADWRIMRYYSRWLNGPQRFLPGTRVFISDKSTKVLDKYTLVHTLGVWPNFRVMAGLLDLQDPDSLKLLLVVAGIMMAEMEERFQDAIKKATQLAFSASEPFHPRTRRWR